MGNLPEGSPGGGGGGGGSGSSSSSSSCSSSSSSRRVYETVTIQQHSQTQLPV
jgi:hypothetical protein